MLVTSFVAGALGLSLNEGAYMAEIVRAGIISVDEGQTEAAQSLGMTRLQTLRRIVLPQAMRVIIPPTGNETISMLKTTSLVIVIAVADLFTATQNISNANYQIVPLLMVASLWYLFFTSVLTIGQYYVERHYARGSTRALPPTPFQRLRQALFHVRRRAGPAAGRRALGGTSWHARADRPVTEPMVEARQVRKSFGRLEVLKGIDLTVGPGEVLCLIGPSGSGKSTFLRCINHLEKIDGGELSVDGELVGYRQQRRQALRAARPGGLRQAGRDRHGLPALQPLPPHERARQRDRRARSGSRGSRPSAARERARRLLERVGLADKVDELPQPALRRPAAAGGHRPGPGHGAQADALRRAHLGPRPRAGGRGARRHARPGRGRA